MNQQDAYKHILRNDLASFVKKSFKTLEPNVALKWGWHLDLICLWLEEIYKRDPVRRLIINIPPRNLKSISVNVAFPAWCWLQDDSTKIISASYKSELSIKHNVDTRRIINSDWYTGYYNVRLAGDQNTKTKIETTNRGVKECGTMRSPPTGSGANILIIDDPHNTKESESEVERTKVCEGFGGDFMTRLNDKKRDSVVIIMQRLHEEDLTGHLLKSGNWEHLCIPAIADKDYTYYYPNSDKIFHIYKKGDILNEALEDENVLKDLKKELGSYAFSGQYMQNPAPAGGGIFRQEWWRYWTVLPQMEYREIFADTASKTQNQNDYSVFQCWGKGKDGNAYLIDQIRGKWESPELLKTAQAFWIKHKAIDNGILRKMIVEDKSSGTGLIQTLKNGIKQDDGSILKIPIGEVTPNKDKITRARDVTPQIESGYVFIPESATWLSDYLYEFKLFPKGSNDDQIDVTDYAIDKLLVKKPVKVRFLGTI